MNRQRNLFVVLGMIWILVAIGLATADSPAERFLQQVKAGGKLDAAQIASLEQELASSEAATVEAAVTSALCRLYPDYEAAVRASDDDDLQQARQLLGGLTGSEDRFLAADASFYLARTMMNHERFEEAKQLLDALNGPLVDFSTHRTITQYYQGLAQAGLLQNDEAIKSLMEFLQFNADAPERLRVSAWRQVQQIQAIKKGQMDDIYQRMDFSRRRLEITEPGERTQEEQDNIVKMLKKLISEQEKKEASSSKGKGKSESESQQQQQRRKTNRRISRKVSRVATAAIPMASSSRRATTRATPAPGVAYGTAVAIRRIRLSKTSCPRGTVKSSNGTMMRSMEMSQAVASRLRAAADRPTKIARQPLL